MREQVPDAEAEGLENADAAARGPIVFLAVPFRAQSENLTNLKGALSSRPGAGGRDGAAGRGRIRQGHQAPRGPAGLGGPAGPGDGPRGRERGERPAHGERVQPVELDSDLDEDVLVTGDSKDAKRGVAELISLIDGLRPVDAGKLEVARLVEGLTPLLISVNIRHKTHAGVKLTGLPEQLWP